ncbi:MAG: SUMF1/EgtB/PvdO family nonheme iron enzyme [Planctomycetes bacterium]|nr:SUMF1/EgtB/PvdO family nonheme iron enzyme [Planctomycetota bacterium]
MSEQSLRPGLRLSEYILVERVGSGGFGEVWVARHAEIAGRMVAIKVPSDRTFTRELRAEAFLQSALVHPNIVRTIGLNTRHDPPFFVMEFVEGISLRDLVRRKKRLQPAQSARIASQVLEALEFAHARGVVHRDVKPGNIICGSDGRVRVTDFGLSQVQNVDASGMKHSGGFKGAAPRLVPGTALYMAPEQRRGQAVDGRADVYAMGVVLFEMLTGELPSGCDLPSEMNPRVPAELDAIVKRAMKSEAGLRYANAAAMRADLEAWLRGDAPSARPAGWAARGGSRWIAATAVATVAVAVAGIVSPMLHKRAAKGPEPVRASFAGAPAEETTVPIAAKAGRVTMKSVPDGADVVIDGHNFGPSPAAIDGLAAGKHVVVFKRRDFAELTTEFNVGPGESLAPTYRLEHLIGGLSLTTDPAGAIIFVDGKEYGPASPALDLRNLPAGRHAIRAELAGCSAYETDVEVDGGRVTARKLVLKEIGFGTLYLESDPVGARVFVDGNAAGSTKEALSVEHLREGTHKVTFVMDGYEEYATELPVTTKDVTTHNAVLKALPCSIDLVAPKGAAVWMDGERRGTGAQAFANLKPGEHKVRVLDVEKTVQVAPGKTVSAKFTCEELGLAAIPAGEFLLGNDAGFPDATPSRKITLSAFAMDRCEVTNRQYRRFLEDVKANGDEAWRHPDQAAGKDHRPGTWSATGTMTEDWPVLGVDWFDAFAYAKWAGKRLPTEAEWERAARGVAGTTYPWGNEGPFAGSETRANVGTRDAGTGGPRTVGSYPAGASHEGVHDLMGNAWEWCADWYAPDAYASASAENPRGPAAGRARVVRGGSFGPHPYEVRAFDRASGDAVMEAKRTVGFRCVADVEGK